MHASRNAGPTAAPDGVSAAIPMLSAVALGRPPSFAHCLRMLDRHGMVQFARNATPNLDFGYCLDDNARAFLASLIALYLDPALEDAQKLGAA
ncbi:MAG: hypothetical protein M3007_06420, partial [Candidatus Eremiobacteraeota bacterium]|nr:hypothetical protein [Candidatus Eremiobacteraeota bacterium]